MRSTIIISFALWMSLALGATARGEDWPQFRGPAGTGVLPSIEHPLEWGEEKNVAWKVAVPGSGWSSPVVAGDRVYIATAVGDKQEKPKGFAAGAADIRSSGLLGIKIPDEKYRFELVCLDLKTGEKLWSDTIAERQPAIPAHPSNTFATETPATDGERVFTHFGSIGIVSCHDKDGKLVWQKDIGAYPRAAGFGSGSSMAIADGRLFVQCDNEQQSFLLALDPETGDEIWRAPRSSKSSWATPVVWKNGVREEVIALGNSQAVAYDPASGNELWRLEKIKGGASSSATGDGKRLYFGTSGPGSVGPLYAVKAGAADDITLAEDSDSNDSVLWYRTRSGPGLSSPVVVDDLLYVIGGRGGIVTCFDAVKGEEVYKKRLPGSGSIAASPWVADGKLFVLDEDGHTFVIKVGREFEVLHVNKLDDVFWSTPSAAGKSLLLRGVDHLYCIRKPDGEK